MIYGEVIGRAELGDALSGKRTRRLRSQLEAGGIVVDKTHVFAGWDNQDGAGLPLFVVTDDGCERDWLAWLVTFAPTLRPISAHIRILGITLYGALTHSEGHRRFQNLENAYVGFVLGDALSSNEGWLSSNLQRASAVGCSSTLAFALARADRVYGTTADIGSVTSSWSTVRRYMQPRDYSRKTEGIAQIASVLASLHSPSSMSSGIVQACADLNMHGQLRGARNWMETAVPGSEAALDAMVGSRSDRFKAFESIAHKITQRQETTEDTAFALACLATQVAPGSIVYGPFLSQWTTRFPSVLAWYMTCAGLVAGSTFNGEFGAIGRRVLRDLGQDSSLERRPHSDLDWRELDMYLGTRPSLSEFITTLSSVAIVELLPGVDTAVRLGPPPAIPDEQGPQMKDAERMLVANELEAVVARLRMLRGRLVHNPNGTVEGSQGSLFDDDPNDRPPEKRKGRRGQ